MELPSKEEIRRKYGIPENDFAILTAQELPPPETFRKESVWAEKLGYWNKFEVWFKRSLVGNTILAVVFIGNVTSGLDAIYKYGTIVYTNGPQIAAYVRSFTAISADEAVGFIVHAPQPPTSEDIARKEWLIVPTGGQIYPLTGAWQLT